MIELLLAAAIAPVGLDSSHIPMGSPLGAMPIVTSPGETLRQLSAPLSEAEWRKQRKIALAREAQQPWARKLSRRMAENGATSGDAVN